ncbi:hypothetical protein Cgig2_025275 [Carnegiea gigantea]|uniref:Uncharacterized protein n=1 Tax=Carnegiea gigantea TaxID=171969 RepID=A0A9Q1KBY0_9CARY|nr:hypothetical protein Cgig2_025275 [Carnegiea gigantea]
MESDRCSTALDTKSTPTTYAKDDPIAKVGKVQHDDGKVMPENVSEGELGDCDSQCTKMLLDNGSYVKDDSSTQVEATKFCIEGDNSSSGSIMRVKEFDRMEELSTGACSSIDSNMEFEEQNANPKSAPPDATSVTRQDYLMVSTYIQGQICDQKCEAAYQKIELGNSLEFFDNHTLSDMVIRVHHSDHQSQQSNMTDGEQCREKKSRARQRTSIPQPAQESNIGENKYELKLFNANSIAWYTEDCNPGKRIKRWRYNGDNQFDQGTHLDRLCGKRKAEGSRLEDD